MPALECLEDKSPGKSDDTLERKECIETRLREAGVRVARSVTVEKGIKGCYTKGHQKPENQTYPGFIEGNYTLHGGDGLVIFDIDISDLSQLPQWIQDLPETFIVESPHGGYHLYFVLDDDTGISDPDTPWGSVRYRRYYLGPGSTIDHSKCDDDKDNCPGQGMGAYEIAVDQPIATLSGDHLDALREICSTPNDPVQIDSDSISAPDTSLVDRGEITLRTLQEISVPAFDTTMNFLQGGIADFNRERLTKENGKIDRDTQDSLAFSLLYGALREVSEYDHPEPLDIATATYTHYCREHPRTQDYQKRRWPNDTDEYRHRIVSYAVGSYNEGKYKHLFNRGENPHRRRMNEYSDTSYKLARATIDILCGDDIDWIESTYRLDLDSVLDAIDERPTDPDSSKDMTPSPGGPRPESSISGSSCATPGPEVGEVVDILAEADRNGEGSYRNILRELRKEGDLKMICMKEGVEYRLCRPCDPEPADADFVMCGGEERDPKPHPASQEEAEPEILIDGGVSEAPQSGDDRAEPEVFVCPVDGCSRTVIGNPSDLRHHVRQSEAEGHRHRSLNAAMEVEINEASYHAMFGPGVSSGRASIYDLGDPWGPGVPE